MFSVSYVSASGGWIGEDLVSGRFKGRSLPVQISGINDNIVDSRESHSVRKMTDVLDWSGLGRCLGQDCTGPV